MMFGTLFNHKIEIGPTNNLQILVRIGCGTFSFTSSKDCASFIQEYMERPKEMEEKYNKSDQIRRGEPIPQMAREARE